MYPTAPAISRVIAFSLLLTGTSASSRAPWLPLPGAAPACDTLAVPVSGLVTLVAPGPNGVIAWTEGNQATEVRVRTAQGELRTIGRNGGGPSEFRIVSALGWRHDTLWTYDSRLRRAQGFAHGTTLLRAVPIARPGTVVARDDTSFIGSLLEVPTAGRPIEIGSSPLTVGVIVPATGTTQTLLSLTPAKSTSVSTPPGFSPPGMVRGNPDASLWCITARGDGDATQLACITSDGKRVLRQDFKLAPYPLAAILWDRSVAELADQFHVPVSEIEKQFTRPRALTAAFDLLINGRSEIWLLRSPPAESASTWQRMTVAGKLLTPVSLPSRLQLRALDGDVAYAADTDADGVQALVRCRLGLRDHAK